MPPAQELAFAQVSGLQQAKHSYRLLATPAESRGFDVRGTGP
ncbi:MAG: hypothetical protein ACK5KU_09655 [Beutenbergiaceae bacterium]